ncbi:MAG: hypothetical protein WC735_04745, partial [Candidatus Paceibacterota bacterium]
WNCVLDEVIERLKKNHVLLSGYKEADKVVVWCEIEEKGWLERIKETQKRGKQVILYQMGVWAHDRVRPPWNEKLVSDVICVWGEGDKEKLIKYGTPAEKIIVTGCPIIPRLKPRVKHEGKNVVFALEHWDLGEDVVENNIVAAELRKLKGVKVITKGVQKENHTEIFENPVESDRFSGNHLDVVAEVLSTADLVVAISESTFAFLAECLDIPVIIADIWTPKIRGKDPRYLEFKSNFSNGVTKVKLENLNKEILWQLKNPQVKRKERAETARLQGGVDIEDPVGELIKIIEK